MLNSFFPFPAEVSVGQEQLGSSGNCGSNSSNGAVANENVGNMEDEFYDLSNDPSIFMDPNYQCIKFQPFQEHTWHTLADETFKEL